MIKKQFIDHGYDVPIVGELLHFAYQEHTQAFCVWFDDTRNTDAHYVRLCATGEDSPPRYRHLGTSQAGEFVAHAYTRRNWDPA